MVGVVDAAFTNKCMFSVYGWQNKRCSQFHIQTYKHIIDLWIHFDIVCFYPLSPERPENQSELTLLPYSRQSGEIQERQGTKTFIVYCSYWELTWHFPAQLTFCNGLFLWCVPSPSIFFYDCGELLTGMFYSFYHEYSWPLLGTFT